MRGGRHRPGVLDLTWEKEGMGGLLAFLLPKDMVIFERRCTLARGRTTTSLPFGEEGGQGGKSVGEREMLERYLDEYFGIERKGHETDARPQTRGLGIGGGAVMFPCF